MNKQKILIGTVLALQEKNYYSTGPKVTNSMWEVTRLTNTQAIAISNGREIRVRLEDLKVVGKDYTRAVIASEEMQAEHAAQVQELSRFRAAVRETNDLIGLQLHQLKLNTEQIEALAKAWKEIKSMAA